MLQESIRKIITSYQLPEGAKKHRYRNHKRRSLAMLSIPSSRHVASHSKMSSTDSSAEQPDWNAAIPLLISKFRGRSHRGIESLLLKATA
jgi:hypothetical protein